MNIDRFSLRGSSLAQRSRVLLALTASAFLLSACGGSSGGSKSSSSAMSSSLSSSNYSAPNLPGNGSGTWPSVKVEAPRLKTLNFEWSAVSGASYYKLFKRQGGTGGSVQIGGNITGTSASDEISAHVHDWVNTYYTVVAFDASNQELGESEQAFTATEMIKAIGYFKASNTDAGDFFGWSVALSGDGKTLAVGAPAEDSNATGANGDQTSNTSTNSGAVYVFVKDAQGAWQQQAYLKASNTEQPTLNNARFLPNDRFGYRVALSDDGNTLAVSAILEDSPSYGVNCNQDNFETKTYYSSSDPSLTVVAAQDYNVGAVYVFKRENGDWQQDAYIKPLFSVTQLSLSEGLRFGTSLALSGDGKTLAVGAPKDSMSLAGISMLQNSSTSSLGCLEFYPSSTSSSSSVSSSISSSSLSSSSTSSTSSTSSYSGGSLSGAVYLYLDSDNGWNQEAYVRAPNAEAGDGFGTSISLSTDGNTLAVGALGEDSSATGVNGDQSNNARLYVEDGTVKVDTKGEKRVNNYRVALSNGAAYVFTRSEGTWAHEAYFKPAFAHGWIVFSNTGVPSAIGTLFGVSVSLSGDGNTLAIGASGDTSTGTGVGANPESVDPSYFNSGAVYLFNRSAGQWAQQSFIKPELPRANLYFGETLHLSGDGNTLAVGLFRDGSNYTGMNGDEADTSAANAGAVYIYQRNGASWSKTDYVKASNTGANDRFGLDVSLSGNGDTLAVGANREASKATGIGGDQENDEADASGAVYVY